MCGCGSRRAIGYRTTVSVVQTICVYVLIPAAIYGVIALLSLASKRNRTPRYKPGQAWSYDPVWWSAHAAR